LTEFKNTLYTGDNLYILHGLNSNLVDLIYLDPPFNTKRLYAAPVGSKAAGASFKDMWTWNDVDEYYLGTLATHFPFLARYITDVGTIHSKAMMAYLTYMAQRIIEMYRILKNTGSLYLHCDPTASHYLKVMLDGIFNKNSFGNDISWCYTGPSGAKKRFPTKHDVILRYVKSENYIFNEDAIRIPYKELHSDKGKNAKIWGSEGKLQNEDLRQNYVKKGKIPEDWWIDIPSGGHISPKERTGYPTQKPLALLHRIIKASSNPNDIVLDPFCGCATTCVAAQQLGRKWIGIDIEEKAVEILVDRLTDDAGIFKDFVATDQIPVRTDIKKIEPTKNVKERLYQEQHRKCNACGNEFNIQNLEIDHIIPKSKGGGDYYENYQLLCGSCNKIKGDRPMEYLRMQIETREKVLKQQIMFGE